MPHHRGLTTLEANELLKSHGANELVIEKRFAQVWQLLQFLSDPMGLMMLGLAVIYFFIGDVSDAVIMLIAFVPVTAVDVFLELRSQKALKALKANLQSTAKVFRDGELVDIDVRFIVPGDIIAFDEGQTLPADGKVVESQNLILNEASLTGESLPVEKEIHSEFYAGTAILSGRGLGLIEKTGSMTKFGKIGSLLEQTESEGSPLQRKVQALVKRVVILAAILVALLFALEYFRGTSVFESLITALTFGMAAIPEEFPLVFTLYLSLGAYRLSRHGVLVKALPSVETLGNVDVICTDKTGTLTEGRFSLVELVSYGNVDTPELNLVARLACEPVPVDAMETAIVEKIGEFANVQKSWNLKFDYPFETTGKHMTHVWSKPDGTSLLAMKGAVEGVLEHADPSPQERDLILKDAHRFASEGKRVLGLATRAANFSGNRELDEQNVKFIGLLVFSDPIRKSVKLALEECQKSGIEVKMLTGDHRLTAHAIADELNIAHTDSAIYTGPQLAEMDLVTRAAAYHSGAIFARVTPEQKYEMVKALKARGKVVAMTGDGVNDSPALKLADVGVSMGVNATDVARSTAKLILLKNDFKGIVEAIKEGRNIFANLRRSFSYLIAFHIPVVLLAFVPPLLGWEQILLPVHIILLELVVHPISAFAFENLKSLEGERSRSLVPLATLVTAVLSGLLLSGSGLWQVHGQVHGSVLGSEMNLDFAHARSLALSTILFGNIGLTLVEAWPNYRSRKVVLIIAVLLTLPFLFCNTPFLSRYFHLSSISINEAIAAFVLGTMASVPTFVYRRLRSMRNSTAL